MEPSDEWVVDFPTLGFLVADWVERHCIIPDGFRKGQPFRMYDWQLWCTCNHYRVKPDARPAGEPYIDEDGEEAFVSGASAFQYRRSQVIAPQKAGKGPWSATITAAEAVGPVLFDGWAEAGDVYRCSDHGCGCGWEWPYEPGDPRGKPWPSPLIQLVATAQTQVDNVYRPLQAMARGDMLSPLMTVGEEFIRLPGDGRIDVVTSSAKSKLGNPIIFALQDETGLYTESNGMVDVANTMRRGVAGMGGRLIETSNAWDPSQDSTAQRTARAAEKQDDIFRYHREPPAALGDYSKAADRRRIHKFAYADAPHVDPDVIEAEALELINAGDPTQAERFYGNRIVAGSAKWISPSAWDRWAQPEDVPGRRERITLGFDGSDGSSSGARVADSTVLRACRLVDGYRWTLGAWEHEPDPDGKFSAWYVPRDEVMERIRWAFRYYDVVLAGFDPPYWRSEIAELTEEFGEDRIVEFNTAQDRLMAAALERLRLAKTPHDGCEVVRRHALNAVTQVKTIRDDNDERKAITLVSKPSKDSPDKIDGLIADAIANDMRDRAIAAGVRKKRAARLVTFR